MQPPNTYYRDTGDIFHDNEFDMYPLGNRYADNWE